MPDEVDLGAHMDKRLLRELKAWEAAEYDGIKGALPSWVPDQFERTFLRDRYDLFIKVLNGECKYEHLLEVLSIYENPIEHIAYEVEGADSGDPPVEVMTNLAKLHKAVIAGEMEGMRMLGGDAFVTTR